MYVNERMERNLGVGNVAEAFFKYWYGRNVHNPSLALAQLGYNPRGRVSGEEKVKLLKSLARSTDFCLYEANTSDPSAVRPALGISINQQAKGYSMWEARSPPGCWTCARRVQQACYEKEVSNVWFNKYNIDNDYKNFQDTFKVEVVLVILFLKWARSVFDKVKKEGLGDALQDYIVKGAGEDPKQTSRVVDLLSREQRKSRPHRKYEMRWLLYSEVHTGKIPYSITGAPVSRGEPRQVVCIDSRTTRPESELVQYLSAISRP